MYRKNKVNNMYVDMCVFLYLFILKNTFCYVDRGSIGCRRDLVAIADGFSDEQVGCFDVSSKV